MLPQKTPAATSKCCTRHLDHLGWGQIKGEQRGHFKVLQPHGPRPDCGHQTTQHRRFWDQTTRRWTYADTLPADDLLRTSGRAKAAVFSGHAPPRPGMWDLTIANDRDVYIDVAFTAVGRGAGAP